MENKEYEELKKLVESLIVALGERSKSQARFNLVVLVLLGLILFSVCR